MKKALKILILILVCSFFNNSVYAKPKLNEIECKKQLENLYNSRSKVFINKDLNSLKNYFNIDHKYGKWALEHEIKRIKYLNNWSYKRNIEFKNISSSFLIYKIKNTSRGINVSFKEICKFDYFYKDDNPKTINSFCVGLRHFTELIKKDDTWIIYNDWYTDCFEDALKAYNSKIEPIDFSNNKILKLQNCPKLIDEKYLGKYNRLNAVKYADKYCGASLKDTTNYKYNKKYKNYGGMGGDCTNFTSQILGDKTAGNLKFDGAWRYDYHKHGGEGSKCWVNADAFKNYVLYNGKGRLIKRGKFNDLIKSTDKYPYGAVQKLQLGDLVCYAKKYDIDHFSIVTSCDSRGYPLINSHTTDRYHVPWDLGWGDKDIFFYFIHIN